jgi:hypothetical protein
LFRVSNSTEIGLFHTVMAHPQGLNALTIKRLPPTVRGLGLA